MVTPQSCMKRALSRHHAKSVAWSPSRLEATATMGCPSYVHTRTASPYSSTAEQPAFGFAEAPPADGRRRDAAIAVGHAEGASLALDQRHRGTSAGGGPEDLRRHPEHGRCSGRPTLGTVHETPAVTASCGRVDSVPKCSALSGIDGEPWPVIEVRTIAVAPRRHRTLTRRASLAPDWGRHSGAELGARHRTRRRMRWPGRWRQLQPMQRVGAADEPTARVPRASHRRRPAPTRERRRRLRRRSRRSRARLGRTASSEPRREPSARPRPPEDLDGEERDAPSDALEPPAAAGKRTEGPTCHGRHPGRSR